MEQVPYLSKRFLLKRYLGLTEEEIVENENMWHEERSESEAPGATGQDLRSVGVTPADLEADITAGQDVAGMGQVPPGMPGAPPGGAPGSQPGAAVAPPPVANA